jgi:hypothetical protein
MATSSGFENQTADLLAHISGRKSSERMASDAEKVLENLQGHHERREELSELTLQYMSAISNSPYTPAAAMSQAENALRRHAARHPMTYASEILQRERSGDISTQQAIDLLKVHTATPIRLARNNLLEQQRRQREAERLAYQTQQLAFAREWEEAATLAAEDRRRQAAASRQEEEEQDWVLAERRRQAEELGRGTWNREPAPKSEPEPEPEVAAASTAMLQRQAPRKILKKMKLKGKE